VLHCLEKEPANRFQSVNDLAFALRNLGGVSTESESVAPIATQRHHPALWLVAALAAGLFLGSAAMYLLLPGDWESARDQTHFIPFATDPEMQAFPRFSPDGKSIAYAKNFQIYVRSLNAAFPTPLTQPPQRAEPAFWSADGTHVYFISIDDNVLRRISSAGGTPADVFDRCESAIRSPDGRALVLQRVETDGRRQLYASTPPGAAPKALLEPSLPLDAYSRLSNFAPDGSKFIVTSALTQELWLVPFPTGNPRRLRELEPAAAAYWFPDSRHVLLLVHTTGRAGFQVLLADTVRGTQNVVLRGPETVNTGDLSPNGQQFVYSTGYPEWDILEFGTNGKRRGNVIATSRLENTASWSPKGDQLAYTSTVGGPMELWTGSADGHKAVLVVRAGSATSYIRSPRFSRDGGRLAYISDDQLWIAPASGGQSIPVFKAEPGHSLPYATVPSWSPDGEFLTICDSAGILRVPSSGGVPVVLKQVETSACLGSPDGRSIAYRAADGVHLSALDGSADRLLFGPEHRNLSCDFTMDGRRYICAESRQAGGYRIVTWDVPTASQIKSVPLDTDRSLTIIGLSLHPDGSRFALSLGKHKYDLWIAEGFPEPTTGLARLFHRWTVAAAGGGQ
jgi:Tol biopolymer transport system component